MIKTLYSPFRKWTEKGTLWAYSDPHFSDPDMVELRKNYIGDDEQVARINSKVGKNDTIIFLGDIGNEEMIRKIRGYKVLIMGNHDKGASKYQRVVTRMSFDRDQYVKDEVYDIASKKYPGWKIDIREDRAGNLYLWSVTADNCLFDEVYEGPLFVAEKLILSHEPVYTYYAFNIHGHEHRYIFRDDHLNVCAEHINYYPINLDKEIKKGLLSKVESIHRRTIDAATERKNKVKDGKYSLVGNRCGCSKCNQRKVNHDETDWYCISYGLAVTLIKNLLECKETLSEKQRDALRLTAATFEEEDKEFREKENDINSD